MGHNYTYTQSSNLLSKLLKGKWDEDTGKPPHLPVKPLPFGSYNQVITNPVVTIDLNTETGRKLVGRYLDLFEQTDKEGILRALIAQKVATNVNRIFQDALEVAEDSIPIELRGEADLEKNIPCLKSYLMGYSFLMLRLSQFIKMETIGSPDSDADPYRFSDMQTLVYILTHPEVWDEKVKEFYKDKNK